MSWLNPVGEADPAGGRESLEGGFVRFATNQGTIAELARKSKPSQGWRMLASRVESFADDLLALDNISAPGED